MEAVREKAIGPGAARAQGFVSCVYHRRTSACVDVEIRQVGEVLKHRFVDQPCASLPDAVRIREDRHIFDTGGAGAKVSKFSVHIEAAPRPAAPIDTGRESKILSCDRFENSAHRRDAGAAGYEDRRPVLR